MLHFVRYYDRTIHPAYFANKGWRGLVIRALNFLRYVIEVQVQYLVLLLIAKEQHFTDETTKATGQIFKNENRYSKAWSTDDIPEEELGNISIDLPTSDERERNYTHRAQRETPAVELTESEKTLQMLAAYGSRTAQRYSHGSGFRQSVDPDGDFDEPDTQLITIKGDQ